jgi:hypothetical protein
MWNIYGFPAQMTRNWLHFRNTNYRHTFVKGETEAQPSLRVCLILSSFSPYHRITTHGNKNFKKLGRNGGDSNKRKLYLWSKNVPIENMDSHRILQMHSDIYAPLWQLRLPYILVRVCRKFHISVRPAVRNCHSTFKHCFIYLTTQ